MATAVPDPFNPSQLRQNQPGLVEDHKSDVSTFRGSPQCIGYLLS